MSIRKYYYLYLILFLCAIFFFASSLYIDREFLKSWGIKIAAVILGIAFFAVLLSKNDISKKVKVSVSIFLFSLICLYIYSFPFFFNASIKLYIYRNEKELTEMNNILLSKDSEVSINVNWTHDKNGVLSESEKKKIFELLDETGNRGVWSSDSAVSYELYGFLDNRYSIAYSQKPLDEIYSSHKRIGDNWYFYSFPIVKKEN